jgi:hypothetical protein
MVATAFYQCPYEEAKQHVALHFILNVLQCRAAQVRSRRCVLVVAYPARGPTFRLIIQDLSRGRVPTGVFSSIFPADTAVRLRALTPPCVIGPCARVLDT